MSKFLPLEYSTRIRSAVEGNREALLELLLDAQYDLGKFVALKTGWATNWQFNEEDVIQEVFVQAFRNVRTIRAVDRTGFLAWLRAIANNHIVDLIRRNKSKKRGSGRVAVVNQGGCARDRKLEFIDSVPQGVDNTPSKFAARNEAIEAMGVALSNLSDEQREAMRLHVFENLTLKETAERMGRSWGSVRGLIQRAKQSLSEAMQSSSLWFDKKG